MEIILKEIRSERHYPIAELRLNRFPIKKLILHPTPAAAMFLKGAQALPLVIGKNARGFLISQGDKAYQIRLNLSKRTNRETAVDILINKVASNGKTEWHDSETIPFPLERGKELWLPLDEHFLLYAPPGFE